MSHQLHHHQRQLLNLMGIQTWVTTSTACEPSHYRVWRDEQFDDVAQISPPVNIVLKSPLEQKSPLIAKTIQSDIQAEKLLEKTAEITPSEVLQHDKSLSKTPFVEYFLGVLNCERYVILAEFTVNIQHAPHQQNDHVQLWYNIQKFLQQMQSTPVEQQVLAWEYDFIDIDQPMLSYFQQGYIDYITQNKVVLVLGDWQSHVWRDDWQRLPSLEQMLADGSAKRALYQAVMANLHKSV